MGLFSDSIAGLLSVRASDPSAPAWDDLWREGNLSDIVGSRGSGGVSVSPETMLNCGVVLAAVRFRANIWSQSQPEVIQKTNGVRKELEDHPIRAVLRDPCAWMTGVRWRHLEMMWAQTWGDGFAEIIGGSRSFAGELRPLNPSVTKVTDQRSDGSLVYETISRGQTRVLGQESVLHFRGPSMDGISGLKMYQLIRNCVGIALLAEKHTSMFLRKGARLSGLLIPTTGDDGGEENRAAIADSVNKAFGGVENTGTMGVLPYGVDFKPLASTNRDSQLLELRDWQVGDALRFLDVPGVVVGYGEKTSTFASADAFFDEAKRCVLPWVVNFEAEEGKALLPRDSALQIKHNLDSVLRADTAARYESLFKAAGRAWMTGNEVRRLEDLNPIEDDPSMEKVAPPPNTNGSGAPGQDPAAAEPPPPARQPRKAPKPPADDGSAALLWGFATEGASRAVRREIGSILGSKGVPGNSQRLAGKPDAFRAWLQMFYVKHSAFVAGLGAMTEERAVAYCTAQREAVLSGGVAVVETWETEVVPRLAAMILGE